MPEDLESPSTEVSSSRWAKKTLLGPFPCERQLQKQGPAAENLLTLGVLLLEYVMANSDPEPVYINTARNSSRAEAPFLNRSSTDHRHKSTIHDDLCIWSPAFRLVTTTYGPGTIARPPHPSVRDRLKEYTWYRDSYPPADHWWWLPPQSFSPSSCSLSSARASRSHTGMPRQPSGQRKRHFPGRNVSLADLVQLR